MYYNLEHNKPLKHKISPTDSPHNVSRFGWSDLKLDDIELDDLGLDDILNGN